MEEEKGQREIQGGKGKEKMIRKGLGSSKGKGILDQRRHWKKEEVFLRIKIIKASWTRVLFDD